MLRLVSGQAANAEDHRIFHHINGITKKTSNKQVITTLLVRLQAERKIGRKHAAKQQGYISKLSVSSYPQNTRVPISVKTKHSREWQGHLQEISEDYQAEGSNEITPPRKEPEDAADKVSACQVEQRSSEGHTKSQTTSNQNMDQYKLQANLGKALSVVLGQNEEVERIDKRPLELKKSKHKNKHLERNYKDALAHLQTKVLAENGRCKRELLDWEEMRTISWCTIWHRHLMKT